MHTEILLEKIETAKALSFEDITSESGTLFSKIWGQGLLSSLLIVLFSLIAGIICLVLYTITILSLGASLEYLDLHTSNNDRVQIVAFIFGSIYSIMVAAVFVAVSAAFYRICKMKDHNRSGFNDYYYFLKKKYFSKIFALGTIMMAISAPSIYYLSYIPLVYLIVPILYFITVFAFNPALSVKDIIAIGFKLGTEKWLISLGFIFVMGLISSILGVILCGFGFIFTLTFVNLPLYVIYKQIFGFDDEKPVDSYQEKTDLIIQKINELNINDKKK